MFDEAKRLSRFREAAERNVKRKCEMERNHCGSGQICHVWRVLCQPALKWHQESKHHFCGSSAALQTEPFFWCLCCKRKKKKWWQKWGQIYLLFMIASFFDMVGRPVVNSCIDIRENLAFKCQLPRPFGKYGAWLCLLRGIVDSKDMRLDTRESRVSSFSKAGKPKFVSMEIKSHALQTNASSLWRVRSSNMLSLRFAEGVVVFVEKAMFAEVGDAAHWWWFLSKCWCVCDDSSFCQIDLTQAFVYPNRTSLSPLTCALRHFCELPQGIVYPEPIFSRPWPSKRNHFSVRDVSLWRWPVGVVDLCCPLNFCFPLNFPAHPLIFLCFWYYFIPWSFFVSLPSVFSCLLPFLLWIVPYLGVYMERASPR